MQVTSLRRRSGISSMVRGVVTTAAVALAACSGESLNTPEDPVLPQDPGVNPQVRSLAWLFDVNTAKKTVKITPPSPAIAKAAGLDLDRNGQVELSLVGSDVIALTASNYAATGVGTGGAPPGKVRVTFDVAITNLLNSVELITPTFPTPPSGETGLFMFSFENVVTTTSGGVSTSGNDVIVELPNVGGVAASVQFDGAPHNWFNDTGCPSGANDCYRYETYGEPLVAGGTTAASQIGFDIDPTVSNFRAKMIVAADLRNAGPAITRSVAGTVTSPQLGPLSAGTVNISGGFSATPSAGSYSIAGVGAGPRSVSFTPPAGCSAPAAQNITVTAASPDPIPVNFTVTCNAPVGTVSGALTFTAGSGAPSLAGVQVTITPAAAGTGPVTVNPSAAGAYSSGSVEVGVGTGAGNGAVSFANLPSGCTLTGAPSSYSGLTQGGSVTAAAVQITCPQSPYPLVYSWSAPSGGNVTLTASIDMGVRNDPLNNGTAADRIGAFQHTINYGTRVSAPSCTPSSGFSGVFNTTGAGVISIVLTNTSGVAGAVPLFSCTFTYGASGTQTLSEAVGSLLAGDQTGYDFTAFVASTFNSIP
ncbi:MAG: hypothetical protein R2882_04210 [Gemmatimonadales bacterium]